MVKLIYPATVRFAIHKASWITCTMNKYNTKYKLIGFTRSSDNIANIMVCSSGKVLNISCSELEKSEISNDLNRLELSQIYKKMYSLNPSITSYELKDKKQSYWIIYAILSVLLSAVVLLSSITGIKPIKIDSLDAVITGGLLIYPITFILLDTLNEFYGIKLARFCILLTMSINVLFLGSLWIISLITPITGWGLDQSFIEITNRMTSVLLASSISYFVSENVNAYLLQKIKKLTNSRYLFIRVIFSTVVAAGIDSLLFTFIAFYGVFGIDLLKNIILTQFIVKVIYAVIGIAPIYLSRYAFKKILT
jgi:uncharacterized integral membrane protein (TIGR00697 family)